MGTGFRMQCLEVMDYAAHYRDQANHARQLADAAWQLDLADMLRSIAKDYDERAEHIEMRQVRAVASHESHLPQANS
jgi:hypothetical protein